MPRLAPLVMVLALGCGASRPAATRRETVDVVVRAHELPSIPPDTGPLLRAEVVLLGLGGIAVGALDLGEVGVDASSCAATDSSTIEGAFDLDDPARPPSIEIACSGVDTGWRIAVIDRTDHVEIWTQLRDEDGGAWQPQSDLALPSGARARLRAEPDLAP